VGTEVGENGLPAYRQVVIAEPRQQGKSVGTLSLMIARVRDVPGTMISYSAQTRLAGRRRFLDVWWPRIRRSPLARLIDVRKGYGSEAFTFANGSMIMLASGTEASDHGDTVHLGVIDEAWAQRDSTIEQALKPAMMTVPSAQLWVVSTAGRTGRRRSGDHCDRAGAEHRYRRGRDRRGGPGGRRPVDGGSGVLRVA
jgi:phage terminase large subunit-like protein